MERNSGGGHALARWGWAISIIVMIPVSGDTTYCQSCPPTVTQQPTESIALSLEFGTPVSCSFSASDGGGYVKDWTTYKIHVAVTVTGICQSYVQNAQCTPNAPQTRYAGTTTLYDSANPNFGPSIVPIGQRTSYDTHNSSEANPVNFSPGGTLGTHTLTSSTNTTPTSCNFLNPFAQTTALRVDVLHCEPKWLTDNQNRIAHLIPPTSPNKVDVFLDPSTFSAAATALDAAISDWNTQVGTTGVTFQRVDTSCGTGPSCIAVQAVTNLGACGHSPSAGTDSSGGLVGGLTLQLDSAWSTWSADSLQRTFAHELGHRLGLNDYARTSACDTTGNSAVMQDNFICSATSHPLKTTVLNDYLPIKDTVYGPVSRTACGY